MLESVSTSERAVMKQRREECRDECRAEKNAETDAETETEAEKNRKSLVQSEKGQTS